MWSIIKSGRWEHHSATIWGPFCIIYGVGVVLVYWLSYILRKKNAVVQSAAYMITGLFVEYFFSLFQGLWFGSTSWDYSTHFLNIGGRVSLIMTLLWGVLGMLFAKLIYSYLNHLLMKLKGNTTIRILCISSIFVVINLVATCMTVTRWRERQNGELPNSKIEQIIDFHYDNEKIEKLFPNMHFIKQ